MNYRNFPKSEEKISILGFGCMRLPLLSESPQDIDIALAKEMVRNAIDCGVNYIDTAYPYHGGKSESFVADVLKDGYREKVYLATKLPSWLVKSQEDMDRLLAEQLKNLETSYIDYYLLHALDKKRWTLLKEYGVFNFIQKALADGKIRKIGFSFHDDLATFKSIIDDYSWDFCQIQYNFLDTEEQAGTEGLDYAYKKDVGIIVMEPLRGGGLTTSVPLEVQELWDSASIERTPAEWALRWVWNNPKITVILSGMSSLEQVEENVTIASAVSADSLSSHELELIGKVADIYKSKIKVSCTACAYCMPCPQKVNIPESFRLYNNASMFGTIPKYRNMYKAMFANHTADLCIGCGECEEKCPQKIPIIDSLKGVVEMLC